MTPRWFSAIVPARPTPKSKAKEQVRVPAKTQRSRRHLHRGAPLAVICAGVLIVVLGATAAEAAAPSGPSLNSVIGALRLWLVGILAGLATLYLTIGGIRYLTAGGDPAEVERAKIALRSALWGYALAALAPLLVSILQSVVGG